MKLGVYLPTLTGWELEDGDRGDGFRKRYERSHEICALCEEVGFDFVALGQHRFTPEAVNPSALLTVLSGLAARTSTLNFLTSILILGLHNPVDVAEEVATIDDMTGGRFRLGVGIGYRPYEYEALGLNFKQRVSRLEEGIEVLRRCWSDTPASYTGRHFTVANAKVHPKPAQRPGPPIWIGAQVETAIMRAARIADGWMTDNVYSAEAMVPMISRYRAEAARNGRPATVVINRKVAIGASRSQVEQRWLPEIVDFYGNYPKLGIPLEPQFGEKVTSGRKLALDDVPDTLVIAGTPDDCIASLRKLRSVTQCDQLVLDFGAGGHGQQYSDIRDAIELFGKEVIPAFT